MILLGTFVSGGRHAGNAIPGRRRGYGASLVGPVFKYHLHVLTSEEGYAYNAKRDEREKARTMYDGKTQSLLA